MRKGRSFELLVERIKHLKIPNAVIKSPEKVKDADTGTEREVDVGVRIERETGSIFIAVECRDRGEVQDITWIEQLITKKQSIQADLVIAVTSSAFTGPARTKASIHGVQLRTVEEFDPQEILTWADETYVEICRIGLKTLNLRILPETGLQLPKPADQYKYYFEDTNEITDFTEFLKRIWDNNLLLRCRDGFKQHRDTVNFNAKLIPKKSISIIVPPAARILEMVCQGLAVRLVDRYPVSRAYKYEDGLRSARLAEGYAYAIQGSEALQLILRDGSSPGRQHENYRRPFKVQEGEIRSRNEVSGKRLRFND